MNRRLTLFNLVITVLLLAGLLLAGCKSATPEPTAAPTTAPTKAPTPTPQPKPTEAPEPTATPQPEPTEAPEPTAAPAPEADEFTIVANYIAERLADWTPVTTADALYDNLNDGDTSNDPFILSVRSPDDYAKGHIPGAYNIPWREIADPENLSHLPTDRQIVVYCYTGHTGQVGATILRLLGYDAVNLKYGIMGWTDDDEVFGQTRFTEPAGYQVETDPHELTETYEPPTLSTGETDPTDIIQKRAQAFLSDWKPVTTADALYENLTDGDTSNDPFILSVRSPDDYAKGHIQGAYNIPWKSIADVDNLSHLPADIPIVTYCYTGHTGEVSAVVLALLGYDVTNLKYGMMGWTDDPDVLAQPSFPGAAGYPVETEPHKLAGGEGGTAILDAASGYFSDGMKLITAEAVYENLNDGDESNDPLIIDIRKPEDYEQGHVPGAVNIGGGALFSAETLAALPQDKQIVVYCYTGQTAGQAVAALNMLGYDAYSLKFGMPSWAIVSGPRWSDDMSMGYEADTEAHELSGSYEMPQPLADDVADAAAAYFGAGFKLITAEAVYENLSDGDDSNNPVIIDIRKPEHYEQGHIPGAVNIGAGALFQPETLAMLPADKQIVVNCYTGQASGQVVAALNLLGYDAYSFKFGMPAWTITEGPRWNDDMSMGYPVDTEPHELP